MSPTIVSRWNFMIYAKNIQRETIVTAFFFYKVLNTELLSKSVFKIKNKNTFITLKGVQKVIKNVKKVSRHVTYNSFALKIYYEKCRYNINNIMTKIYFFAGIQLQHFFYILRTIKAYLILQNSHFGQKCRYNSFALSPRSVPYH